MYITFSVKQVKAAVTDRPLEHGLPRLLHVVALLVNVAVRKPEVNQVDEFVILVCRIPDQQVVWLDVAMNKPELVQCLKPTELL